VSLRRVTVQVWLGLLVLFAILTTVTNGGAQSWAWIGMLVLVFGGLAVLLLGAREDKR
jgi:hypothetical protein